MKIALYTVGPLTNVYSGPHTYSDVLIPFVQELSKEHEVEWLGIQVKNTKDNKVLNELNIKLYPELVHSMEYDMSYPTTTWDFIKPENYDVFLCQPRPSSNKLENTILLELVDKFLKANKPVFCWEVDMYTDLFTEEMREKVILLHPAQLPTGKFKTEIYFPFFTYTREDLPMGLISKRELDFVFLGNIYFRHAQALQFFAQMNNSTFNKLVFGSWIQDEERRVFSSQFDKFEFADSCEHWAAIPVMQKAKATLHIVPDFAKIRGLMTARVFTSQMARCLCFCDSEIYEANKFFPSELIVKDGADLISKWEYAQTHKEELLTKRDELLKEFTVENRVKQFTQLLKDTLNHES